MRIVLIRDDGTEVDVTEGVQVCYDLLVGSMNWGSGFLSTEEAAQVKDLGAAAGFQVAEYPGDPCARCRHKRDHHSRGGCHVGAMRDDACTCEAFVEPAEETDG